MKLSSSILERVTPGKVLFIPALVMLLGLLSAHPASAQQEGGILLFEPDPMTQLQEDLPGEEIARHYVRINRQAFSPGTLRPGDRISYLLDDNLHTFEIERISSYTEGTFSILARGEGGFGNHLSMTVEEDRIAGTVHLHQYRELYHLRYDSRQRSNYIARVDYESLDKLACGLSDEHLGSGLMRGGQGTSPDRRDGPSESPVQQEVRGGFQQGDDLQRSGEFPLPSTASDETTTIDVMIVYTPAAASWMRLQGGTNQVIAQSMNLSQQAIDNSDVQIELRLVHTHMTDMDERDAGTGGYSIGAGLLCMLTTSPNATPAFCDSDLHRGHMNEVHELRDLVGADLVAMFADEPGVGGIAWIPLTSEGIPELGFSVNRVQQMNNSYTLVHELGHNMGLHHSRNQAQAEAPASGGVFLYSTGWRWDGDDGNNYVSVMTYNLAADGVTQGTRVAHFSNPDVTYRGVPTGSYEGAFSPADAARSMNEMRHVIASYREEAVEPSAPPPSPLLATPSNRQYNVRRLPRLLWERPDEAVSYRVQLSEDPGFHNLLVDEVVTSPTLIPATSLNHASEYFWRVRAKNRRGAGDWSQTWSFFTVVDVTKLSPNFPNPLRDRTTIPYQLESEVDVLIDLFDITGRRVAVLVDERQVPRPYQLELDASRFASGVYILRMRAGDFMDIQRMTVIK